MEVNKKKSGWKGEVFKDKIKKKPKNIVHKRIY